MSNLELSSPWQIYVNRLASLFGQDPEIHIDFEPEDCEVILRVDNLTKAAALEQLLPESVEFGNVELFIIIVPANSSYSLAGLYEVAFKDNPIFRSMESIESEAGFPANYCIFKKEVAQYKADDLSSYYGVQSTLYEEIAREVFKDNHEGIYFCTSLAE